MLREYYIRLSLKAHHAEMGRALEWLEQHLGVGVSARVLSQVMVLVEELFTNTIDHGYRWECDEPVEVGYRIDPAFLNIYYSDHAPQFDPRQERVLVDQYIGGNGLLFIRQIPNKLDYEYIDGWNRIYLKFALDAEKKKTE